MVQTQPLSEETIQRLAPDASAVQAARGLVRKKSFKNLGISADGTWLLAQCQGSGKDPYEVSVDLVQPSAPVGRCTCPSRKFPCKHSLGLMLAYAADPDSFKEREPSEDLLAKREKKAKRSEKAADGPKEPRKVNKSAQLKKAQAQRDGLDLLEKLLLDLVAGGQWYEPSRLNQLERQAKQLRDHYLPGAAVGLKSFAVFGQDEYWEEGEKRNKELEHKQTIEAGARICSYLWSMVQRGRNYLDGKLAGDETQDEADAAIEQVLGHAWQLTELREKGYCRHDLRLLELAYSRLNNFAREERHEISYLLDLKEGNVYRAVTYRPWRSLKFVPEQPSYSEVLRIKEAAIYPGFGTPRIRWEKNLEETEPVNSGILQTAYSLAAKSFESVVSDFRKGRKNPLANEESVGIYWVQCAAIGLAGEYLVLEDSEGNRLRPVGEAGNLDANYMNLYRAGSMLHKPAVLIRIDCFDSNGIYVEALAVLTPEVHLRLGV